ncbi:MAG: HAMP domain-containing protein, partial [Betaproteobacteria bacterium]
VSTASLRGAIRTEHTRLRSKKNILIMPGFQGRMILFVVLVGFVGAALNGYLYYSYVVDSYDFVFRHSSLPEELKDQRYSDLFVFGASLVVATLVVTLAVAIWALFITHRAAGSVYHIQRVIGEIRSGNLKARVHLREKDEFQDLARSFNELMDELQKKPDLV